MSAIVAVVGPTASGKSALALALAERLGGEIVSCDSVQVYRGLDIGSGKATAAERARIPHHLLDVASPEEPFDAAKYALLAARAITEIEARGRWPILVGGTGLYYRALVQGLFDAPPPDPATRLRHREEAAREGVESLHARLAAIDPRAAARIMPRDLVRISRALEIHELTGRPISALWEEAAQRSAVEAWTILLAPELPLLRTLIDARVDAMMAAGFLDEVVQLRRAHGPGVHALGALGYKQLGAHLDGVCSVQDAVAETKAATVAYARRQRTWFRKEAVARTIPVFGTDDAGTQADLLAVEIARRRLC